MRLTVAPAVERDLIDIGDYIARDSPIRATSFLRELREEFHEIAQHPFAYEARPDIAPGIRVAVFGRYLILFRIGESSVSIRRVLHGARDLPRIRF